MPDSTTSALTMRSLVAVASCLALFLSGASSASAAETIPFGPLSPTNDPTVSLSGTVTVEGDTLELVMTLSPPSTGQDYCFTAQKRWTGVSFPAEPASMCGNAGGEFTVTSTLTGLPDTVDVRICSGEKSTLDESTCTPWTRVFAGAPKTSLKKWGPVKAKRGLAVVHGKIKGDRITTVLTDRTRQTARCGWAIYKVTAGGEKHKSRTHACNGRKSSARTYAGLTKARVKVCSGTKKRPNKQTCRAVRLRK